jgi:hypothetical protein
MGDPYREGRDRAIRLIHLSNYSDNRSIQIYCDGSYTEPKWGPKSGLTDVEGVYESDDERLYTFDRSKVTCPKCQENESADR